MQAPKVPETLNAKVDNEQLCIICITFIAVLSMSLLGTDASNIVSATGGGLVGYLTRGSE